MSDFIEITVTYPDGPTGRSEAENFTMALVKSHMAACGQVSGPVFSVYHWQETLETATEWKCQFKSRRSRFLEFCAAVKASHPYDIPEIIASELIQVDADYLQWMKKEVPKKSTKKIKEE